MILKKEKKGVKTCKERRLFSIGATQRDPINFSMLSSEHWNVNIERFESVEMKSFDPQKATIIINRNVARSNECNQTNKKKKKKIKQQ